MPSVRAPRLLAAVLIGAGILTSGLSDCARLANSPAADDAHAVHTQAAPTACSPKADCTAEAERQSAPCAQMHCPIAAVTGATLADDPGARCSTLVGYAPSFPDSRDVTPDPPPPRVSLA